MNPTSLLRFATTISMTTMTTNCIERSILCSDGIKLAAKHWNPPNEAKETTTTPSKKILCLHGWLDNADSFHLLGPSLSSNPQCEILALDLPGHGLSSHKSPDGPMQLLAEYVYYVSEVANSLNWDVFTLIGHSMGGNVGVMYAAAFPERLGGLVLLESGGPISRDGKDAAKLIRKAIEKRRISNQRLYPQFSEGENEDIRDARGAHWNHARVYPSIERAIQTRIFTAKNFPGNQYISREAAKVMVERATMPAPSSSNPDGVIFRHDPRLNSPSLQYNTAEQVEAFLKNILCPTCLVLAEDGWPMEKMGDIEIQKSALRLDMSQTFPGSHHLHADPNTSSAVITYVEEFLRKYDDFDPLGM